MGKLQVKFRFLIASEKLYELANGEFGVLSPRMFQRVAFQATLLYLSEPRGSRNHGKASSEIPLSYRLREAL